MPVNMQKRKIMNLLLFSGIGVFAWLVLGNYAGPSQDSDNALRTVWAGIMLVVIFDLLGAMTMKLGAWLNVRYIQKTGRRWEMSAAYLLVMLLFLGVDYGFLAVGKLIMGAEHPFAIPAYGGLRILAAVWLAEIAVLGLALLNMASEQNCALREQAAKLREENSAAGYAALQNQLNPHFLFNSLNTLVAEIEYDPRQAAVFTRSLSDIYRYVLQVQDRQLVPLSDELDFAKSFLYLHEVRLGDCLICHTDIMDDYDGYRLPPLTLQMLIENVIKHNVMTPARPVDVFITVSGGVLSVSNTLRPKANSNPSGIGLANLSRRCIMTVGKDIEVIRSETVFTVKIPLLYE